MSQSDAGKPWWSTGAGIGAIATVVAALIGAAVTWAVSNRDDRDGPSTPSPPTVTSAQLTAITLSPSTGRVLSTFMVAGSGFTSDERVRLVFGDFNLAGDWPVVGGTFSANGFVPNGARVGTSYIVTAIGLQTGRSTTASFLVIG